MGFLRVFRVFLGGFCGTLAVFLRGFRWFFGWVYGSFWVNFEGYLGEF